MRRSSHIVVFPNLISGHTLCFWLKSHVLHQTCHPSPSINNRSPSQERPSHLSESRSSPRLLPLDIDIEKFLARTNHSDPSPDALTSSRSTSQRHSHDLGHYLHVPVTRRCHVSPCRHPEDVLHLETNQSLLFWGAASARRIYTSPSDEAAHFAKRAHQRLSKQPLNIFRIRVH